MDTIDRACALSPIHAFIRNENLHYTDGRRIYGVKPTRLLRYCFGGTARHWGNVLYNNEMPTRLDLQCLRASIGLEDVGEITQKSIRIRAMQKAANHGNVELVKGAKPPINRRDKSVYRADSLRVIDELLEEIIEKLVFV